MSSKHMKFQCAWKSWKSRGILLMLVENFCS